MAMKETDYILATNLRSMVLACEALRTVHAGDAFGVPEAKLRHIEARAIDLRDQLFTLVETEE